jgi:hypothetical protein
LDGITLFDPSYPATRCVSCRAALANAPPERCPRCGADNRAWYAWTQAGLKEHLKRFFLRSPWGWLALVSLLLPLVSWGAFDFERPAFETDLLSASLLLSLAGLFLLFLGRDALWVYELAGLVSPRFRAGLLHLGGAGFLAFALVGSWGLGAARPGYPDPGDRDGIRDAVRAGGSWGLPVPAVPIPETGMPRGPGGAVREERPGFIHPLPWEIMAMMGLAFTAQALAAGLYSVYAYGRWSSGAFPAPVFWDEARLLYLVERAARPRIQVKTGRYEYEALATQVVALSRTDQAGLSLKIRAEVATEEVFEGHLLKAVQHWRVVSDQWGHVKQLGPEGPLEYIPDGYRTYPAPDAEDMPGALEGEIIFPKKRTSPTPEEAIIIALTSGRRRRQL